MFATLKTKYMPEREYEIVSSGRYHDGSPAIQIIGPDGPELTATVKLPDHTPEPRHVMIKNWSENEGILGALQSAGIIEFPVRTIPINFVEAHECKLTDAGWALC